MFPDAVKHAIDLLHSHLCVWASPSHRLRGQEIRRVREEGLVQQKHAAHAEASMKERMINSARAVYQILVLLEVFAKFIEEFTELLSQA